MKRFICLLACVSSPVLAQTPYPFPSGSPMPTSFVAPTPPPTNYFNCVDLLAQMQALDEQHTQLILQIYPINDKIKEIENSIALNYQQYFKLQAREMELNDKKRSSTGLTQEEVEEYDEILGVLVIYASNQHTYQNQLDSWKGKKMTLLTQINAIMGQRSMLQSFYDINCR